MVTLRGVHLDLVDAVWVGDRVAIGQIIKNSSKELMVRVQVPAGIKPGRYWLHAAQAEREIPMTGERHWAKGHFLPGGLCRAGSGMSRSPAGSTPGTITQTSFPS